MAFSSDDQTAVEQAIRDLATGQRVVRMTVAGKSMEFGQSDLGQLRGLLQQVSEDVAAAAVTQAPSYVLTRCGKGL